MDARCSVIEARVTLRPTCFAPILRHQCCSILSTMKPRTLAQLSFAQLLSSGPLERRYLPLYLRAKFLQFEAQRDLFKRLYLSNISINIPEECFAVEEFLNFDPVETIRSIRKYLTPLNYFKLCATFGHPELAEEAWTQLGKRQKLTLMSESSKYLKVSPVQAEAIHLASKEQLSPLPLIACSSWVNVCAAVFCASNGWQYSMARNLQQFINQEVLFDEKVIECCLHAIKQDHPHVVVFIYRNPMLSKAFRNSRAFLNPLRLFSLIDTKTRDEKLLEKIDRFAAARKEIDVFKKFVIETCAN